MYAGNLGGARRPARAEYQQIEIHEKGERDAAYAASHEAFSTGPRHHGSSADGKAGISEQSPSDGYQASISRAFFHEFVR